MQAIILSIGDELVLGQTVDTNSAYLSAELAKLGVGTLYHQTIADDRALIVKAIRDAGTAAELVIVTGGLGPTDDDLTRPAMAEAMGVELVRDAGAVEFIRSFFDARGRTMPERNLVQADFPHGSTVIPNSCGTAPGIKCKLGRATFYVTPGVPREMVAMWEKSVRPELLGASASRGVILTATIHTFGAGESTVAEKLGPLMARDRNPRVGTTVAGGFVSVRLRSEFDKPEQAQREMDDTMRLAEVALGSIAFGHDGESLEAGVLALLKQRKLTLASAESCTGGLLGKMLTDVSGSSAAYVGGWVTYSNAMKASQLGVPETLLAAHGAVSEPVARAMAEGARSHSGADCALSITGVAGPDGGTPAKPVGTIWIALAGRKGCEAMLFNLPGERDMVRDRAAKCALQMLRFTLLGIPLEELQWGRRSMDAATTA